MALARKHCRQLIAKEVFHRSQNMKLVIDHDIVPGGVALLHIIQHLLFVDVDQHSALGGLPQSGTLNFARLKDHVAVGQDDGQAPFPKMFDRIQ